MNKLPKHIQTQEMETLLSIDEAAEVLRLSSWTIRAWIRVGKMGSVRLGSRVLVSRTEINRLITSNTVPVRIHTK